MARATKMLEAMRANPRDDWRISDVQSVCAGFDVICAAPRRGSHYTVSHPGIVPILTIPARRPIKPVYIAALVEFIDSVLKCRP